MAKDPKQRFNTALDLASAARSAAAEKAGSRQQAPPPPPPPQPPRPPAPPPPPPPRPQPQPQPQREAPRTNIGQPWSGQPVNNSAPNWPAAQFTGPPPPSGSGSGSKKGLIAALVAIVAALVAIAIAIVVAVNTLGDDDPPPLAGPGPSFDDSSYSVTTTTTRRTTTSRTTVRTTTVPPPPPKATNKATSDQAINTASIGTCILQWVGGFFEQLPCDTTKNATVYKVYKVTNTINDCHLANDYYAGPSTDRGVVLCLTLVKKEIK